MSKGLFADTPTARDALGNSKMAEALPDHGL
jgi:hypothetical protein